MATMPAYWGVPTNGIPASVRASDISESIPLDLHASADRAEKLLILELGGVDSLLATALEHPPSASGL